MVKKLYKHECIAWLRFLPWIWGITLAVAGIHRLMQLFETDSIFYVILIGFTSVVYVLALLACPAFTTIFGVVRFYRHFFTGEGYLTFTLPVSYKAHLWVKISTAALFTLVSSAVCLLSGLIVTTGEVFVEVIKAAQYLIRQAPADITAHLPWYGLEFAFIGICSLFYGYLMYGTCICLGQLAHKHRILAAVGVYFGFYMVTQTLSTVGNVTFMMLTETGTLDSLNTFIANNAQLCVHIGLGACIVLSVVCSLVFWLICHWVLRKRINLE